jgi:uncharacterized protein (DUF302 family)
MRHAVSGCGLTDTASVAVSALAKEPKVSRNNIQVEHIRIDSDKPYNEVRAALEQLPRFDDRIRALLHYGEITRVKVELEKIQGADGLVIFSFATHGDWLQLVSEKRNAVQYVIGNVLVSTQMTQHELAAGLYAPLRIMLYENDAGTATFEYDQPSTLFGQHGNKRVTAVAKELDKKIYDALIKAATGGLDLVREEDQFVRAPSSALGWSQMKPTRGDILKEDIQ